MEEVAKCGVCLEVLGCDVNQCKRGHGVCSRCSSQLNCCPTCKEPFLDHKPTLLIQVLELLPKLCQYTDRGCKVIHMAFEYHSFHCGYRPIKCKFSKYHTCEWSGLVREFKSHVQEKHPVYFYEYPTGQHRKLVIKNFKGGWHTQYFMHVVDTNIFLVYAHKDQANKRFAVVVKNLPVNDLCPTYYFIVNFTKQEIVYKHSIKALAITNLEECLDDSPYSMVVPMDEMDRFLTNTGTLEGFIKAEKVGMSS